MQLTKADCDTLVDALKSWEHATMQNEMMGDMLVAVLSRNEEDKQKMQAEREAKKAKREADQAQRSETAILLMAKVFALRKEAAE